MTVTYKCECLVDQGRVVGGDPVGHACFNDARYELEDGTLMCDSCRQLWLDGTGRVTFGPLPKGRAYQEATAKLIVDDLLKRVKGGAQ